MSLPPPDRAALLLDMDGTLLDIAPTPDLVRVPAGLAQALSRVREALGGALAIITGRPIEQVDGLFPAVPYAVAGEHGGAIRPAPGAEIIRPGLPVPPAHWAIEAAKLVEAHPGALLEQKQRGFVLHFRAVPQAGPALLAAAEALVGPHVDQFQIMPAAMAWEIRPRGADKGTAVQALCAEAPFAGRSPVFIGDDVTDEDAIAAARTLGGAGMRVDEAFGSPEGVRRWLHEAAVTLPGHWPALAPAAP